MAGVLGEGAGVQAEEQPFRPLPAWACYAAPMAAATIQLWPILLAASPEVEARLWTLLRPEEQERARRFATAALTSRFVLCRGALRSLLGQQLGQPAEQIVFASGPQGKPFVAGSELCFNLSHSQELALLATSADTPLGVDVEQVRPMPDLLAVARHAFAPAEVKQLLQLPEEGPARQQAFFRCWTRKEACVKATGAGLSAQLQDFTVTLLPGEEAGVISSQPGLPGGPWQLHHLEPGAGFVGALAYQGERRALHWHGVRGAGDW